LLFFVSDVITGVGLSFFG